MNEVTKAKDEGAKLSVVEQKTTKDEENGEEIRNFTESFRLFPLYLAK